MPGVGDDAGGGRRGLRAAPSVALFEALHDAYGLVRVGGTSDLGGSSNLNLLVTDGHEYLVARIYRPYVTMSRLDDIQRVRRELAAGGLPCARTWPTRAGTTWVNVAGRLMEVETYVAKDAVMDSWERLEIALPLLGRVHALLRTVTVTDEGANPLFANYLGIQDTLTATIRGTNRIRAWGASPAELCLAASADQLARLTATHAAEAVHALPRQLVHGDFWDNNIFFREEEVVLIGDFDFMGQRARIDDLALTLYFAAAAHLRDLPAEAQISRLRHLVEVYEQGLEEGLTRQERAALPLAIARQPLWSIGGWIAHLDDARSARRHARGLGRDLEWALQIMDDLERWQGGFA